MHYAGTFERLHCQLQCYQCHHVSLRSFFLLSLVEARQEKKSGLLERLDIELLHSDRLPIDRLNSQV